MTKLTDKCLHCSRNKLIYYDGFDLCKRCGYKSGDVERLAGKSVAKKNLEIYYVKSFLEKINKNYSHDCKMWFFYSKFHRQTDYIMGLKRNNNGEVEQWLKN